MGVNSEAMLDAKMIDLIKLLHVYLAHFPRFEKFSLCAQIRDTAYDLYGLIAMAQKKFYKKTTLFEADVVHEKLRMLIRLAFELGYLSFYDKRKTSKPETQQGLERLINLQTLIDEIGRQLGGWISFVKSQKG